ncbi:MAG TPA: response regulator, partial [Verrucomicrobiae bacterium]
MDVQMPLMGGLEATTHLRRLFPGARIILMSLQDSPSIQRAAFARGAHGFVGKTRIMDELMPEIERVFGLKPADEAPPAS